MKTIKEQIAVMQHFANGGEVEYINELYNKWKIASTPNWNWEYTDYRIKEQKKTVTIEKWLINDGECYITVEASDINKTLFDNIQKVKLLDTYEVEI